jgi:hypothetical protein
MSMVNPQAESPFYLRPQTTPRVRAEEGAVIARLELLSRDGKKPDLDIEIVLEASLAKQFGWTLVEAAKKLS